MPWFVEITNLFKTFDAKNAISIWIKKKMTDQEQPNNEPQWDYTSSRQNFITGAMVVGGNVLVVLIYLLYRTVPSVHQFISGKPL